MPPVHDPAPEPHANAIHASNHLAAFWSREPPRLLDELRTRPQGLSSAEASRRLEEHGPNTLDEERAGGMWRLALRQFKSPLVLILVFGGIVSATLREWIDAAIILAIVLGSCGLGFAQEFRASNAVAQLRRRLALTVQVRRDDALSTLETRNLVPGDIVELSAGNLISADASRRSRISVAWMYCAPTRPER